MKINAVRSEFYELCQTVDEEIMIDKETNPELRPCLIIVKLKYKGRKQDFAIPLRSNIKSNTPKEQYMPLPNTAKTRKGNRAGIHYIKMFPIHKMFLIKYNINSRHFAKTYNKILNKINQIVSEAQNYLDEYESGVRHMYCTNIDAINNIVNRYVSELKVQKEVAVDISK